MEAVWYRIMQNHAAASLISLVVVGKDLASDLELLHDRLGLLLRPDCNLTTVFSNALQKPSASSSFLIARFPPAEIEGPQKLRHGDEEVAFGQVDSGTYTAACAVAKMVTASSIAQVL